MRDERDAEESEFWKGKERVKKWSGKNPDGLDTVANRMRAIRIGKIE